MVATMEKKAHIDLANFDYKEYEKFLPSQVAETLTKAFTEKQYGWGKKAKLLASVAYHHVLAANQEQKLIELCNPRARRSTTLSDRDHGRKFLAGLSDEKLRLSAEMYQVSWDSYMKPNAEDRVGLIEAILDEMV